MRLHRHSWERVHPLKFVRNATGKLGSFIATTAFYEMFCLLQDGGSKLLIPGCKAALQIRLDHLFSPTLMQQDDSRV